MNKRTANVLWSLALLCACAAEPSLRPIAKGDAVAIAVGEDPNVDGVIDIQNTAIADNMSAGIGSGAVVGGLWGLACGPLAVLCVPLGAAAGIVTGAAAGAAVGATAVLPAEKAARVRDRLTRLQRAHPIVVELNQNLSDRAGKYWGVATDHPTAFVTVVVQRLKVASTRDERLQLTIAALVTVRQSSEGHEVQVSKKSYHYVSPYGSLAVWLDETGDFADTTFTSASQQIAAQIIADMLAN